MRSNHRGGTGEGGAAAASAARRVRAVSPPLDRGPAAKKPRVAAQDNLADAAYAEQDCLLVMRRSRIL